MDEKYTELKETCERKEKIWKYEMDQYKQALESKIDSIVKLNLLTTKLWTKIIEMHADDAEGLADFISECYE
jgi:hypothetical protein